MGCLARGRQLRALKELGQDSMSAIEEGLSLYPDQ